MKIIVENLKLKKYKRKGIESCFSVLKDDFDIDNIKVRSIWGFASTINQRVLAYNLKYLHEDQCLHHLKKI